MSFLYFILGLCPILWLIFALTVLGWPTYKAAFGSLIISALLSVAIWQQSFLNTVTAACEGFLMALWPIIVVIIAASISLIGSARKTANTLFWIKSGRIKIKGINKISFLKQASNRLTFACPRAIKLCWQQT